MAADFSPFGGLDPVRLVHESEGDPGIIFVSAGELRPQVGEHRPSLSGVFEGCAKITTIIVDIDDYGAKIAEFLDALVEVF